MMNYASGGRARAKKILKGCGYAAGGGVKSGEKKGMKSGGAAMKAGAGSGMGRLEKTRNV